MALGDDPYDLISAYSGIGLPQPTMTARQKFAQQLLLEGTAATPVAHPLQALARTLQGGLGGYLVGQSEREALASQAARNNAILQAYGISPPGAPGAPGAPGGPGPAPSGGPVEPYTQIGRETVPASGLPPLGRPPSSVPPPRVANSTACLRGSGSRSRLQPKQRERMRR